MQTASLKNGTLKIGTRGSKLALAQAYETRRRLMEAHGLPEEAIEIVPMSTAGDRIQDRALSEIGGKGLLPKEIEQALTDGQIDLAVHSTKDMPTILPDGLHLSVFLEREDPAMPLSVARLPAFLICRRARQSDRHRCVVRL